MIIAVDTGGTKTLVALFDGDGAPITQHRFPTPRDQAIYTEQLIQTIHRLSPSQPAAIAVGLPGRVLADGTLALARNLGWGEFRIADALSPHFSCPIIVENDANLAGLGEVRVLSPTPRNALYITISTGINTGIITDGIINPYFSQSESGQMVLEYSGTLTRWEKFSSGRAIVETYGMLARDITDPAIWQEIAEKISRGLLALLPVLRPDIVILGGSIGAHLDKYKTPLRKILSEQLHYVAPIEVAVHPDEAVIYGCNRYALDHLAHS